MSSVYRNSARPGLSGRSYISTATFENDFFQFTISQDANFNTIATRALVTGATSGNCPKGRVLRENGKKLFPGQYPTVTQYYVGVFDPYSGLRGYIDPNSPLFAPYNTDKPYWVDIANTSHMDGTDPGPGGLKDLGAPVLTNGTIESTVGLTTGTTVAAGTSVTAGTIVTATNVLTWGTTALGGTVVIDLSLYQNAIITINSATNISVAFSNRSLGRTCDLTIINSSGASRDVTFDITSVFAGGSFNMTGGGQLTNGQRRAHRFVCLTSTQAYATSSLTY